MLSRSGRFLVGSRDGARRVALLFFVSVIAFTATQPTSVMALVALDQASQPKQPSVLSAGKVDIAKQQATFDAAPGKPMSAKKVDATKAYEDISKRTATTSTYINKDGTKTLSYSLDAQNFKVGSSWHKIDNKLETTATRTPQKSPLQTITLAPEIPIPTAFKGKAGTVQAQMRSLHDGVTISAAGKTITMRPSGARNVLPEKKDDRTVVYKNAWPNVDLEYELRGELVKEIIVIKSKSAQAVFDFTVDGGKVITHPTRAGELTIEGMPPEFSFSSLTLDVNGRGVISEQRVTQAPSSTGIKVMMNLSLIHI